MSRKYQLDRFCPLVAVVEVLDCHHSKAHRHSTTQFSGTVHFRTVGSICHAQYCTWPAWIKD